MKNKKVKKLRIYTYIVLILIAGLYIDIKMQSKGNGRCVANGYNQRTLNIQFIIPFHPQRHVLALGVGNKHWEHDKRITRYWEGLRGEDIDERRYEVIPLVPPVLLEEDVYESGCSYRHEAWMLNWVHYLDLRPFAKIEGEGQINTTINDKVVTKEHYEEWYK